MDPDQLVNVASERRYVKLHLGVALFGIADWKENMKAFVDKRDPELATHMCPSLKERNGCGRLGEGHDWIRCCVEEDGSSVEDWKVGRSGTSQMHCG
jgi:hypothetical protein